MAKKKKSDNEIRIDNLLVTNIFMSVQSMISYSISLNKLEKIYKLVADWMEDLENFKDPVVKNIIFDLPGDQNIMNSNKRTRQLAIDIQHIIDEDVKDPESLPSVVNRLNAITGHDAEKGTLPPLKDSNLEAFPFFNNPEKRGNLPPALLNHDEISLKLKLKVKGLKKPPIWREITLPGTFNFHNLHDVIQIIFGWTNSHLWQFYDNFYDPSFEIAGPYVDDYASSDFHKAPYVNITQVLKEKGDKVCYQYDFGDGWEIEIEVKDILNYNDSKIILNAHKGEFMPEDMGGVWVFQNARDIYSNISSLPKKEIKKFLNDFMGNISEKEFTYIMEDLEFDAEYIQEELDDYLPDDIDFDDYE